MAEEHAPRMTPFDQKVVGHQLQLIKAMIPYVPVSEQKFIAVFVKFQELQNTIDFFDQGRDNLKACALGAGMDSFMDMINDMQNYCFEEDKNMLGSAANMMSMLQMYQTYQEAMKQMAPDEGDSGGGNGNTMDLLKAMLPPEQQDMLNTYSAMFQSSGKD